jgi:uncharacterized protein (TIGR03546 family)
MFWINIVKKFIGLFHSNINPDEIAAGFALGSIIGFTPFFALHNLFVFFLIIIFNVNIGAAMFGAFIFSMVGVFTDPIAHQIGYLLLVKAEALTPFWTQLYNMPIVPFTRFNNTVVLGSLIISIILFIPVWLMFKKLIILYRTKWKDKVDKWKIMQLMKSTSIYDYYTKFKG